MKTIRVTIAIYAIFTLSIGASAQTHGPDGSLMENPVYQHNCAKCHGKAATGRHFGGPSLASQSVTTASSDDLHNMIANGKGHMPRFAGKLKPAEIDQLVAQIKALGQQ